MSYKALHEIKFKDEKHYDLYMFAARFLGIRVEDPEYFEVTEQPWRDRYKVSLGNHTWYINKEYLPRFWLLLNKEQNLFEGFKEIVENTAADKDISYAPNVLGLDSEYVISPDETFYSLTGEDFLAVDRRLEGLITTCSSTIREIASIINKEMDAIAVDTSVVKDFDGILTFNTEMGKKFNVHLCFDKVPPVDPVNEQFVVQRTPIKEDDLQTYLRDAGKKINSRLSHINDLVKSLFASATVNVDPWVVKYTEIAINMTLAKAFLDQNVTYVSFGGKDNWKSNGPETANNAACFAFLDKEVDKLFKLLDEIPKQEGVDVYSIDVDTFSIFGRNDDNKVVTPALQGYTADILKNYSHGFERTLSTRLAQLDSPHIFRA